jgi:tetratricopeptide (TPR) repeat protein
MVAVREPRLTSPKKAERRGVPKGVLDHFVRGDQFHSAGQFASALAEYDAALAVWHDSAYLLNNRGDALYHLGHYEEALQAFERAIEVRPEYFDALFNRGLTLLQMGLLEEADAAIKQAVTFLPDADLAALLNELRDESLRRLRRKGIISWSGGKPGGARPRVRVSDGPPLSDYIVESRR